MGTFARTVLPSVPTSWVTDSRPASASSGEVETGLPMRSGLGWVSRIPRSSVMTANWMPERSRSSRVIARSESVISFAGIGSRASEARVDPSRTSGAEASARAVASASVSLTSVTARAAIHANTPVTRAKVATMTASWLTRTRREKARDERDTSPH